MSKQNWQLQLQVPPSLHAGMPEWRDICTRAGRPGPATKKEAERHLVTIRRHCTPGNVYRIVEVSPL